MSSKYFNRFFVALLLIGSGLIVSAQTHNKLFTDGSVIFKVKPGVAHEFEVDAQGRFKDIEVFPFLKDIRERYSVTGVERTMYISKDDFLRRILTLKFSDYENADVIVRELSNLAEVEYAEKEPWISFENNGINPYADAIATADELAEAMNKSALTPNDPRFSQQTNMGQRPRTRSATCRAASRTCSAGSATTPTICRA
jgi:hypothetical protein